MNQDFKRFTPIIFYYRLIYYIIIVFCFLGKGKKKKRKLKSEHETLDDFGEESTCSDNNTQESDQARLSTLNFFPYDNSSIQENMYSR